MHWKSTDKSLIVCESCAVGCQIRSTIHLRQDIRSKLSSKVSIYKSVHSLTKQAELPASPVNCALLGVNVLRAVMCVLGCRGFLVQKGY